MRERSREWQEQRRRQRPELQLGSCVLPGPLGFAPSTSLRAGLSGTAEAAVATWPVLRHRPVGTTFVRVPFPLYAIYFSSGWRDGKFRRLELACRDDKPWRMWEFRGRQNFVKAWLAGCLSLRQPEAHAVKLNQRASGKMGSRLKSTSRSEITIEEPKKTALKGKMSGNFGQ
jgi:hypothetical protein